MAVIILKLTHDLFSDRILNADTRLFTCTYDVGKYKKTGFSEWFARGLSAGWGGIPTFLDCYDRVLIAVTKLGLIP